MMSMSVGDDIYANVSRPLTENVEQYNDFYVIIIYIYFK